MASTNITFDILANDRASSKFNALGKSVDKSTSHMARMGKVAKTAALGVAAVGVGALAAGKYVFDYGAKLEQMGMKAETVFGNQLGSVQRWAEKSAGAMGLTSREATGLAANFADLLIPMGFTRKQAAGMSTDVVGLSGALSQWSGGVKSAAEVTDILNAAMLGETDGLKALGISISAAEVDAELLKRGQDKLTGATRQQAEALAVQRLIMAKSTDAQAAFAKGGSPLLSAQAKIKSALGEVRDELIVGMVPAMSAAAEWAGDHLPGALEALQDKAGPVFEAIVDGGKEILDAVKPAVEEIAEALGHMIGPTSDAGDMFEDKFIPALKTTADLVGGLVNFVDELPGPVKHLGAEAGIAAIAFNLLSTGVGKASGAMSGLIGSTATAETRLASLKGAASTAAGIGGMLLLVKSTDEANDGLKALEKTAGGALTGFAIAGPIGGAVGATTGLATSFHDLQNAFEDVLGITDTYRDEMASVKEQDQLAADAADRHKNAVEALRDTLDAAQNTAQTLEPAYANVVAQLEGAGISAATADRQWKLLGISQRTVAQASLGNADAMRAINKAYAAAPLKNRIINEHTLADAIDNSRAANREAIRLERQRLRLTQEWGGKLKSLPKEARTAIRLDGVQPTLRGVAKVVDKYNIVDKKSIKTILEVTGVDATVADVKRAQGELDKTDKKRPKPKVELFGYTQMMNEVNTANRGLINLDGNRADTYIYTHHVDTYERRGSGGGGSDTPPSLHRFTGGPLGRTTTSLLRPGGPTAFQGLGAAIVRAFAKGINGSAGEAEHAVDRMMAAIAKALKNKDITEAAAKRMRETVQAMAREADKGRAMLSKRADFANTLRDSFAGELGLGELVSSEGFAGIGSITGSVQSLANRLRAFAGQLTELRQAGIPRTLIGEIASLGSDQGAKAAAAILAGSKGDRNALASAYNQLQNAAGMAGNAGANAMYGTVGQIKNEFHININAGLGSNGREIGRELEQALTKWARDQGRPLNFPTS